jgi:hypothetical protein
MVLLLNMKAGGCLEGGFALLGSFSGSCTVYSCWVLERAIMSKIIRTDLCFKSDACRSVSQRSSHHLFFQLLLFGALTPCQ